MKLHTLTLVTLTALATFAALPGTAATDPSTAPAADAATHQGPGRFRGGPGPGGPHGPAVRLEQLDTNNDSKISKEEFLTPRLDRLDDMFSRRDANNDGLIADGEGRPQRGDRGEGNERGGRSERGHRGDRPEVAEIDREAMLACIKKQVPDFVAPEPPLADGNGRDFDDADTNGDGNLSLSELTASVTANAEAQFARLDDNGDGFITSAETGERQQGRADVAAAMRDCAREQRNN